MLTEPEEGVRYLFPSRVLIGFVASIFLVCATGVMAQTNTGILRGSVTDPSGAAVPGAAVQLTNSSGQVVTATTSRFGAYEMRGLAPGKYSLQVTANGFGAF